MLKITGSLHLVLKKFNANVDKNVKVGGRVDKIFKNSSKSKKSNNDKSKNFMHVLNFIVMGKFLFLTPNARKSFSFLKQAFIEALIL